MQQVVSVLSKILNLVNNKIPLLSIETDLTPRNINHLFAKPELDGLGVLVDVGNAAANGFSLAEYFDLFPNRIFGLHIKDRSLMFGGTCSLGTGEAEFDLVSKRYKELPQLNDITLQAFRSPNNYIQDAKKALSFFKEKIENGR